MESPATFRKRWLSPLLTMLAAAWVFFDGTVVGALDLSRWGRHGCWIPRRDDIAVTRTQSGWTFAPQATGNEDALVTIYPPRRTTTGMWAPTRTSVFYMVSWDGNAGVAEHPKEFFSSLESWLLAQPQAGTISPDSITTVRALVAHGFFPQPWAAYTAEDKTLIWIGVVNDAATALIAFVGLVSAFSWANQAAARQLARMRLALSSCPTCGYDIRGLPEPKCPECGGDLPATSTPA